MVVTSEASIGDVDELKRLAATGVDLNEGEYDKRTGIHLVCAEGHIDVVKFLVAKGINPSPKDHFVGTPLGVYNVTIGDAWDGSRIKKTAESNFMAFYTPGRNPVARVWPHVYFEDGRVVLNRYKLGALAKEAGVISLESLTPDMSDVKFRHAIALWPDDPNRIQEFISSNIIGELLTGVEDKE